MGNEDKFRYLYIHRHRVEIADSPDDDPKVRHTTNYLLHLDDDHVIVHVPGHAKRQRGTNRQTYRVPTYFYVFTWCAMRPVWNDKKTVLQGLAKIVAKVQSWSSEDLRREVAAESFDNYRKSIDTR